jgi:hypothetical protein
VVDQKMEKLYHLVLSGDEMAVVILGMLAVDGVVHHNIEEAFKELVIEYMKLRLTTDTDVHAGLHRLGAKLNKIADNIETNKGASK